MSKKRGSVNQGKSVSRRQMLECFGALVVTAACSGNDNGENGGTGATHSTAGSGGTNSAGGGGKGGTATVGGSAGATGTGGSAGTTGAGGSAGATGSGGTAGATGSGGGAGVTGSGGSAGATGAGGSAGATGSGGTAGTSGSAGGGAGGNGGVSGSSGSAGSGGSAGGGGNGDLVPLDPDDFDDVANCTVTPTDPAGEGPFFIHDDEAMDDPDLFAGNDIRRGKPGVEFQIHLRVLDSSAACDTPVAGVEVYIWHTDALGFYSGFANQNPDMTYTGAIERTIENGDRFCRGAGITNADGVVSFRSIYPGWYNGRAVHVHFVALKPGSGPTTQSYRGNQYHVFTTQFYFDEAFSRDIHENNAPYTTRASGQNYERYVRPETAVRPTLTKTGNVVVGKLNILTNPAMSRR